MISQEFLIQWCIVPQNMPCRYSLDLNLFWCNLNFANVGKYNKSSKCSCCVWTLGWSSIFKKLCERSCSIAIFILHILIENHYIKIPHTRNACNIVLRASDICPALLVACWKERRWKIKSSSLMIKLWWAELGWVVQQNKWLLVVVNMDFPAHGLCVMTSNKIFLVQCSCYVNKNIFISSAPIGLLVTNHFLKILLQFCIL